MFDGLKQLGVIGINRRVIDYMLPLNPRKYYPLVDDKVKTAALAREHGIPMPENYFVFESYGDLKKLKTFLDTHTSIVIKPAKGAQGNGIIVLDKIDGQWRRASGGILTVSDIRYHISQIVGGLYSLSALPDKAIIQYKVVLHSCYKDLVACGVPDIRVIVCQGYPIMAMTRLPTRESDGRANLHQGAVGAGLDIKTCLLYTSDAADES